MKRFSGYVQNIKFSSKNSGFFILNMYIEQKQKSYVVIGNIFGINLHEGSWFSFEGEWKIHPKYGPQINIIRAPIFEDDKPDDVFKMLVAHGVEEFYLQQIRDYYQEDFLESLQNLNKLKEVIEDSKAVMIHDRWKIVTSVFKSIDILSSLGISNQTLGRIWKIFPDNVYGLLTSNPWALVKVEGIEFEFCDQLANRLGIPFEKEERMEGAALCSVQKTRGMGSLYVGSGNVVKGIQSLIKNPDVSNIGKALGKLHQAKDIIIDKQYGSAAIYEPWNYKCEDYSAKSLAKKMSGARLSEETHRKLERLLPSGSSLEDRIRSLIRSSTGSESFELSDQQEQAIINAILQPVSILTGGPGSGKTTTLKRLVQILRDLDVVFSLVAPTGVAAKRLQLISGRKASTIHKEFGATGFTDNTKDATYEGIVNNSITQEITDGSESNWAFHEECPHGAQVVIVDETSMVDQHCLYRMLAATSPECRFVLVGDAAQLPSVGAGNVLSDLIRSDIFPIVRLNKIFRQKDTSEIVFVAREIEEGNVPPDSIMKEDFLFIEQRKEEEILETILQLAGSCYEKRHNFQVISPRHRGTLGVTNLNSQLRKLLNPRKNHRKELKVGNDSIREEDRVMVFQNDYALDVYNGDMGKISFISDNRKDIEIRLHEHPPRDVLLKQDDARRLLRLAYAITCHKSQGNAWDVIILPWVKGFGKQLKRNLLYTAITRAKKRVIMVGHKEAFEKSILNGKDDPRNTLFCERLVTYSKG